MAEWAGDTIRTILDAADEFEGSRVRMRPQRIAGGRRN